MLRLQVEPVEIRGAEAGLAIIQHLFHVGYARHRVHARARDEVEWNAAVAASSLGQERTRKSGKQRARLAS